MLHDKLKTAYHHVKHTRPKWYHKYHQWEHHGTLHMAILVISIFIMFFGFATAVMLILLPPALAASPQEGRVSARPAKYDPQNPKTRSWFIYDLPPGESKEDSIQVMNLSEETIYVKVYPVDATTTQEGFFALLNEDSKQTEVGTWIKMKSNVVTIEPKSNKDVPFTITVPKYTTIGDHPGGIIVQEVEKPNPEKKGIGLNIISRMGVRVYETVPGDKIANMDLRDFTYKIVDDHLVYNFTLENLGNIILDPNGRIELKDEAGKIIDTINFVNLGSVFPRKPTFYNFKSEKERPLFGKFTATVIVNYATTKAVSKSIDFYLYLKNWEYLISIPLIVLILSIVITLLVRRLRHHKHFRRFVPARQPIAPLPQPQPPYNPSPAFSGLAPALSPSIDQLFIARHIKLIIFLIPTSVIIFSCIFAVMLYLFAVSRTGALPFAPTLFAPAANQNEGTPPTDVRANDHSPLQISPQQTNKLSSTSTPSNLSPIPSQSLKPASAAFDAVEGPTPQKSGMQIEVLNASGIEGAAKTIADKLTANGYNVNNIDNSFEDVFQTIIRYPEGKLNDAAQLETELKPDFTNIKLEKTEVSSGFTIILVN